MSTEEILKMSAAVLGWLTAIVGWIVGIVQWRKKRKAEAELKLIRRRGDAPYLATSDTFFTMLYYSVHGGELRCFQSENANVLSFNRHEVDKGVPADAPILFVVANEGQAARRISISLAGKPIQLKQEPDIRDAHGIQFLEYPYEPAQHGKPQKLTINFETSTGVQDHHVYEIIHGFRSLKRIDPS